MLSCGGDRLAVARIDAASPDYYQCPAGHRHIAEPFVNNGQAGFHGNHDDASCVRVFGLQRLEAVRNPKCLPVDVGHGWDSPIVLLHMIATVGARTVYRAIRNRGWMARGTAAVPTQKAGGRSKVVCTFYQGFQWSR